MVDTKQLIWLLFGIVLVAGGLLASVQEGKSRPPRTVVSTPTVQPDRHFDTGFSIDPVKGLQRKDENAEYFK